MTAYSIPYLGSFHSWRDIPSLFALKYKNMFQSFTFISDQQAFHQCWVALTGYDTIVALNTETGATLWRIHVPKSEWNRIEMISDPSESPPRLIVLGKSSIVINGLTGEFSKLSLSFNSLDSSLLILNELKNSKEKTLGVLDFSNLSFESYNLSNSMDLNVVQPMKSNSTFYFYKFQDKKRIFGFQVSSKVRFYSFFLLIFTF